MGSNRENVFPQKVGVQKSKSKVLAKSASSLEIEGELVFHLVDFIWLAFLVS